MRACLLLILTCFSLGCDTKAQNDFDRKTFLAKKVNMSADIQATLKEFDNYRHCGLDSMDMKYFVNGPVLGSLLVEMTANSDSVTYNDVLNVIQPFLKDPVYIKLKRAHTELIARRNEVITRANWPELRTLIIDAYGYDDARMQSLDDLCKDNMAKKWTVGNLMNTFTTEDEK